MLSVPGNNGNQSSRRCVNLQMLLSLILTLIICVGNQFKSWAHKPLELWVTREITLWMWLFPSSFYKKNHWRQQKWQLFYNFVCNCLHDHSDSSIDSLALRFHFPSLRGLVSLARYFDLHLFGNRHRALFYSLSCVLMCQVSFDVLFSKMESVRRSVAPSTLTNWRCFTVVSTSSYTN